jgi:hypothetical protein
MNDLRNLVTFTLLLPLAVGCAGRTAPFNEMDQAQITVLRLSPPPPAAPAAGQPGALIPGIPPELQQMGQQILQGAQQVLPPGLIPPGLLPGQPAPQQPPPPMWKGYAITAQQPLTDDKLKNELLDIFGSEDSFSSQRGNCFMPGLGVSMARSNAPPVDLLISLSCNQTQGDGFTWPYPGKAGFTTETHERLSKVYQALFGPVPPGA